MLYAIAVQYNLRNSAIRGNTLTETIEVELDEDMSLDERETQIEYEILDRLSQVVEYEYLIPDPEDEE